MSIQKGWIGFDLDGTLAEYNGWKGINHIGEPIWPIISLLKSFRAIGFHVRIFTARAHNLKLVGSIDRTTGEVITDPIQPIRDWCLKYIGEVLPVTNVKDFDMIALYDDRSIQVAKNTGTIIGFDFLVKGIEDV